MKPAMCTLSWDDGYPLAFRIAEMMSRHRLRGTFYIPRTAERATMSAALIRELSQTFEVGAHTLSYAVLTRLDDRRAKEAIFGARKWLEDFTGNARLLFCPPDGHYAGRHERMIEQAGYSAMRTVELLSLDWPRRRGALLSMSTRVQAWSHDARSYLQNITKRDSLRNLRRYIAPGRAADWPELSRIILAKWEIESCQTWKRLADVMRFLADCRHDAPALTNGEVCGLAPTRLAASPPWTNVDSLPPAVHP